MPTLRMRFCTSYDMKSREMLFIQAYFAFLKSREKMSVQSVYISFILKAGPGRLFEKLY